jgi:hypothetical protein
MKQAYGHEMVRLKILRALIALVAGALMFSGAGAHADDPVGLAQRLQSGGHILMLRHALAPGTGDPSHFRIDDCRTQRNLNAQGRTQARHIGEWLRAHGVAEARVFSSQWCRCLETAALIDLGPVTPLPALNSFFERPRERESRLDALQRFIARQPPKGKLIVLVTHYVTIAGITGEAVSSGEGVVLAIDPTPASRVIGRIDFGLD